MCWRKLFSFLSVFFCAHKIIHEEMSVFTFREFSYSLLHAKIGLNGIVKQSYFVRWAGRVWKSLPCSSSCIQLRTISWVFSSFSSSNGSRCYLVKQTVAKLISVKLRLNWFFFSLLLKTNKRFFVVHEPSSLCSSVNHERAGKDHNQTVQAI